MSKKHTKKIITAIIILLFSTVWTIIEQTNNSQNQVSPISNQTKEVTPTPMPFQEMTIPYLKNRRYNSKLAELNQKYENTSYTAYLTSYSSDNLQINALLTIPKTNKPKNGYPAVVFIHGYIPPQNYQTTGNYAASVDYIARNNIVVFKIDLRGHGNSEGEASGAYYSSDYVIDTLNAYTALENADFVDKNNIGLWGHSMAGNITFRAIAAKPNIPKIVIWAGAVYTYEDFEEFRISDISYQRPAEQSERARKRNELFDIHGRFDPKSDFWKQVAATNYLDNIKTKIQIHHAIDDNVVNIGYSRNLAKILKKENISHQLFEYENGGHNITGSSFEQAMSKTVEFLKNNKEIAKVTKVIDGDTIELENGKKLRYIGIDTPETKHPNKAVECYGEEAYQKNKKLVEGKNIEIEKDISETDRYGRLLRYVYVNGEMNIKQLSN